MRAYLTYFGYFGWLALLAYIANRERYLVTKQEHVNGRTVTRYNWIFALAIVSVLIYLASMRGRNFADTVQYWSGFVNSPTSFSAIPSYLAKINKDKAFYFFAAFWHCLLGNRPVVYLGIIASFQAILMAKTLRKYSVNMIMSMFIFVASTDCLSFMYNGIRQFVAVCIIFGFSEFIFEKKYIRAVIVVLIASLFHQSALLMLPVMFMVQDEPWNKKTIAMLVASMLAIVFVNQFTQVLDALLEDTQYTNVVSDWTSWNDDGTNPIRVAVYLVPTLLSLIGLRIIREENDTVINICANMSIFTAALYLISMVTSGIFIGRLPIYMSLYSNCILLPWEVDHMFNKKSSAFIKAAMIVLYLLFYYYQLHFTWGNI